MFLALLFLVHLSANPSADEGELVPVISHGENVVLEDHLEAGKFVIFEYYAEWSSASRKWGPLLARFARKYPDKVVVKRIDIKSWGTPVAIKHHVKELPYVRAFNDDGKKGKKGHPREVLNYFERKAKKKKW